MSLTLNMVGGGGSGDAFAFIRVTYPTGSVCTATNGTKTLTASDTSGYYVFKIPTPLSIPETWTIACADGTSTASKNVTVSEDGQSISVYLQFPLYIVKNGYFVNSYSFPNSLRSSGSSVTITENEGGNGYMKLLQGEEKTGGVVSDLIDLTDYDIIGYEAAFTSTESAAYGTIGSFNAINRTSASAVTGAQVATARLSADQTTGEIDISGISQSLYIGVMIYTASNSNNKIHQIWNLWLE